MAKMHLVNPAKRGLGPQTYCGRRVDVGGTISITHAPELFRDATDACGACRTWLDQQHPEGANTVPVRAEAHGEVCATDPCTTCEALARVAQLARVANVAGPELRGLVRASPYLRDAVQQLLHAFVGPDGHPREDVHPDVVIPAVKAAHAALARAARRG
jgi:hypothetical protein